jgi:anthranilate synthase component I
VSEEPPGRFASAVERIHEYLRAGDVFQVNLSRAWTASLARGVTAEDLYARLRLSNPAPFAGLACWKGGAVLSSSPERLVEVRGRAVQTRPIAGTRPRGADGAADLALQQQLMASAKERAEHIMLIDLERNDLGRVCEPGSVEVSELMRVESYAHVHHIVSNVRGRLRAGAAPGAVLKAVFPGGTITGCPKVRAMEIIAELEGTGRGPYTGAMGYLGRDGRMDLNILIRTLVCEDGQVTLRAGAGIVADSQGEAELAETRVKARGLLQAIGAAA